MSQRTKTCPQCGKHFSHQTPVGRNKTYCSAECKKRRRLVVRKEAWDDRPECETPGCQKKVRASSKAKCSACHTQERKRKAGVCQVHKCSDPALRSNGTLCEKHYYRMRRTGAVYKQQPVYRYITNAGYIKVKDPSHPLAASDGTVFEHRYVKHKELGDGDHPCFWCGSLVEWQSAVVDHLNEAKSDNRAENLVYSCNNCNRARGAMLPLVERLRPEALEAFIDQVWSHWVRANG